MKIPKSSRTAEPEPRQKNVTHQDIARHVGVSQATVSKVLGNKANSLGISQKTRLAVIEAAKELGYNKDKIASSLIQLVEKSIAVLLEHITNPYCGVIMRGIEDELEKTEYQYLFASSNGHPERSQNSIASLTRRYTTGFILMPFYESDTSRSVHAFLKGRGIPFVQTSYYNLPGALDAPLVSSDNYGMFAELMRHLLSVGHERFAFFYTSPQFSSVANRLAAFRDAHTEANLPLRPSLLVEVDRASYFDVSAKHKVLDRWLALKKPPTAIVTMKDDCAIQFIRMLEARGLRVPDDMAVTGCDDVHHYLPKFYDEAYYRLTTIRQNLPEVGRCAVRTLIDLIENPAESREAREILLPAQLIVRGSCGSAELTAGEPSAQEIDLPGLGTGHLTH